MNDVKLAPWGRNLYLKFADHRVPGDPSDGAARSDRMPRAGHAIYDLGCGAGNISRILAERTFAGAGHRHRLVGGHALPRRAARPPIRASASAGDLRRFEPEPAAIDPYSNAAYQWVEVISTISRPLVAAVGRPARHPDAAQPRGAVACLDASGRRRRPVARHKLAQVVSGIRAVHGRRATTTC